MADITDPDQITEGDEVTTNTTTRRQLISPITGTNLPNAEDGIPLQVLYSWDKEEWKDVANRSRYPFPLEAITPEEMEWRKNWEPTDDTTRKAIREGGWREIDTDDGGKIKKEFAGIKTLGNFEDNVNDKAWYQVGLDETDLAGAIDFDFAGPVNEGIESYNENYVANDLTFVDGGGGNDQITRASGSWITDGYKVGGQITILNANTPANNGTYPILAMVALTIDVATASLTAESNDVLATAARNFRNTIRVFLRNRDGDPTGKTYALQDLSDIGKTSLANKLFSFPLSSISDGNITETDANIVANSPYTQMALKFFAAAFDREVDSPATNRLFGMVMDVGTHSGVDGSFSAAGAVLTTAEGGITGADFIGGTIRIHDQTDKGTVYNISGTPTATTVTITGTFTATESAVSFTLQRAAPIVASKFQIFEKLQHSLRQAANINDIAGVINGKTQDPLAIFEGANLVLSQEVPVNPAGGGSGLIIEGFDTNDTNNLFYYDNGGVKRNFPFVAAFTIFFSQTLQDDAGPAEYTVYFQYTERFTETTFGFSAPSGDTVTLDSSVIDLTAELTQNDFIVISGFAAQENNGTFEVTGVPAGAGPWTAVLTKRFELDQGQPSIEAAGATVSIDKNPVDTDDAIVVNNNAGSPITGTIGAASVVGDFDYENNVQGGRTANTDAAVVIRGMGTNKAQEAELLATITKTTGLEFRLDSVFERNYSNP